MLYFYYFYIVENKKNNERILLIIVTNGCLFFSNYYLLAKCFTELRYLCFFVNLYNIIIYIGYIFINVCYKNIL